jgi:hypothetical protein
MFGGKQFFVRGFNKFFCSCLAAAEAFSLMLISFFTFFHVSRKEKYFHKFSVLPLYIIFDIRIRRKKKY